MINTKQSQIQKANKNNIGWGKILSITIISYISLCFVVTLLLSTALGRKIFDFLCEFGQPIYYKFGGRPIPHFRCGASPAVGVLLVLTGTPFIAFTLAVVTAKNKRFLHGILAGLLGGFFIYIIFLWFLLAQVAVLLKKIFSLL